MKKLCLALLSLALLALAHAGQTNVWLSWQHPQLANATNIFQLANPDGSPLQVLNPPVYFIVFAKTNLSVTNWFPLVTVCNTNRAQISVSTDPTTPTFISLVASNSLGVSPFCATGVVYVPLASGDSLRLTP